MDKREELFHEYRDQVDKIARIIAGRDFYGIQQEEAEQIGRIALWKLLQKADRLDFSMAMMWQSVRWAIIDEIRKERWFHGSLDRRKSNGYEGPMYLEEGAAEEISSWNEEYDGGFDEAECLVDLEEGLARSDLSEKEKRAARLLASGFLPHEVADILGVSRTSISHYRADIREAIPHLADLR